jgi:uncharacterized protein (TIGR03435 family)
MMRATTCLLLMCLIPVARPVAQTSSVIEVATVKRNVSQIGPGNYPGIRPAGTGVNATMVSVLDLVGFAYDMNIAHMVNVPSWAGSERFDVAVRAVEGLEPGDGRGLLRELLAERFGFQGHTETRQMPVHRLLRIRADHLGPGLRATTASVDCDVSPQPSPGMCGVAPAPQGFAGTAATMPQIMRLLTALAGQFGGVDDLLLTDATDLAGRFDIDFKFSARDAYVARTGSADTAPDPAGSANAFQTALGDQLGLKIESRLGPIEALVIDRVDRPSPD